MVINLDILLLENIIVNYFLLYITSQTVRNRREFRKIILPALIGGIYVITLVFPKLSVFTSFPFKILVSFLMIILLFRKKGIVFNIKALLIYLLYSMLLAGLCFFIELNQNSNLQINTVIVNFSYKKLLLCLILIYLLIDRIVVYVRDRKELKSFIYTIDIINKHKKTRLKAFLDTGNELREPATNLPVIIIERRYFNDFNINNNEKLYIPYKVVDGQGGKLEGFKPEYVIIYNGSEMEKREVVVAFCENRLSAFNDYNAILSRGII
ncbi:sigma-E processing peptidase SpoIIGA [Clostridium sp. SYSU_GA19001]|uniref:sigma-E processing peptidase SpoIIGA n=1 Tax=Clostridium caldaquaticum TaxID=2940653 RepID=UPI0020771809|nr:sigma-E processing peptidase SpoIIGA [Clostridium caldaquaticum]MCM8710477.1 sigma-E processing peptidase SpoIIGA [Clostridium caldaquaticum]